MELMNDQVSIMTTIEANTRRRACTSNPDLPHQMKQNGRAGKMYRKFNENPSCELTMTKTLNAGANNANPSRYRTLGEQAKHEDGRDTVESKSSNMLPHGTFTSAAAI